MIFSKKLWKPAMGYGIMEEITEKYCNIGCDRMKYSFNKTALSCKGDFCSISSDSFKSACVSVSFMLPLGDDASLYALVPNVLTRSSQNYENLAAVERKLANLYGAELIVDVSKVGETQVIKLMQNKIPFCFFAQRLFHRDPSDREKFFPVYHIFPTG